MSYLCLMLATLTTAVLILREAPIRLASYTPAFVQYMKLWTHDFFNVLTSYFRHLLFFHADYFYAIVNITQLSLRGKHYSPFLNNVEFRIYFWVCIWYGSYVVA